MLVHSIGECLGSELCSTGGAAFAGRFPDGMRLRRPKWVGNSLRKTPGMYLVNGCKWQFLHVGLSLIAATGAITLLEFERKAREERGSHRPPLAVSATFVVFVTAAGPATFADVVGLLLFSQR